MVQPAPEGMDYHHAADHARSLGEFSDDFSKFRQVLGVFEEIV
jgi:hypothetical protein